MRDTIQELRELGLRGTLFRAGWEMRTRSGLLGIAPPGAREPGTVGGSWVSLLTFGDPVSVAHAVRPLIPPASLAALREQAEAAAHGRILCFQSYVADFGDPIDWNLNPLNGKRWPAHGPWTHALRDEPVVGDVKLTWEVARFPHAYAMARASAFFPEMRESMAAALLGQMESFVARNPVGRGIHWNSGQEIGLRLLAWLFAHDVLLSRTSVRQRATSLVRDAILAAAPFIERHVDYARIAVYNNHLLSEALALYSAGVLMAGAEGARTWRDHGRDLLVHGAKRQFYEDGAYIQQSHNYHRVALQAFVWAWMVARAEGERPDPAWMSALEHSLDFLVSQQNPVDGWLPNYGSNDGALPSILSTCAFSDFRSILQTVSVLTRGERIYSPGSWDEATAWVLGPDALDVPLRPRRRVSVSFASTGYHLLRSSDESTFAAFRCGTVRDRFTQIDQLHVDVWWRGHNVLVDGGSYLYNGSEEWHAHFLRTASHNTVGIDGRDQMLHHRRFKVLYRARARLLRFEDSGDHVLAAGEHYGYARHRGQCVHRRSLLLLPGDIWVVLDHIGGVGEHLVRLHWLGGEFPFEAGPSSMHLATPAGPFSVSVHDQEARPVEATVVAGQESPPRGWLSRKYATRVPVPSLAVERRGQLPMVLLSILGPGRPSLERAGDGFVVRAGEASHAFRVEEGMIVPGARGSR